MVINSEDVQDICSAIVDTLSSFDRRMVKAILTKNRALVMLVVYFVYGGTKDKLMKIAGSVKK